jgi:hypothetical protein
LISKRVDRKNHTSDFERLGCYILEVKSLNDKILWTTADEYRIGSQQVDHKVLSYRITNCVAEVPAMAMAEVLITQKQNTRSKADKTYHLIISFPDEEIPTPEQLRDIEDEFCKELGFAQHQRISAVHQDTENLHLHIAINKVHPQNFKVIEPFRDFVILSKTCRLLEQRHGLKVDNGLGQATRKSKSFLGWLEKTVKEPLKGQLKTAASWNDLHDLLGPYGLTIKPRGAGLVIALVDGSLSVKASDLLRELSFKKLTTRWGEYQPPSPEQLRTAISEQCYTQENPLWKEYQEHKGQFKAQRAEAYRQLKIEHDTHTQQLKNWYQGRHDSLNTNIKLTAKSKRKLRQQLYNEQKADFAIRRKQEAEQRQVIREQYPNLTWDQWLIQQANQGNKSALRLLRARDRVRQRLTQELLTVKSLEEAKVIIYPQLKPKTRKNGDVLYRLKDGGMVEDTAKAVFLPEVTEAAVLLALALAQERFPGQPLIINGSSNFKSKIAQMTVTKGMNLRFDAKEIEHERQKQADLLKTQEAEGRREPPRLQPDRGQGRI